MVLTQLREHLEVHQDHCCLSLGGHTEPPLPLGTGDQRQRLLVPHISSLLVCKTKIHIKTERALEAACPCPLSYKERVRDIEIAGGICPWPGTVRAWTALQLSQRCPLLFLEHIKRQHGEWKDVGLGVRGLSPNRAVPLSCHLIILIR